MGQRAVRGTGWTLIILGIHILLYLVYLLWWTGLETSAAQTELLDAFTLDYGDPVDALPGEYGEDDGIEAEPVDVGDAYAAIWFERDGQRIVRDDVLLVVEGVDLGSLKRGPGHDPNSDRPGGPGNFVISGHRTTYQGPFYNLDRLIPGDEIHVVDNAGAKWVYVVDGQPGPGGTEIGHRIVRPTDVWVIKRGANGPAPTLTLTTCHPRFSASQRMIVFATLQVPEDPDEADTLDPSEAPA